MTLKASYHFTNNAQNDLVDILRRKRDKWGNHRSKRYLLGLRRTCKFLATKPNLGKRQKQVGEDVFSFSHISHEIYFFIKGSKLIIFGIVHKNTIPVGLR